MPAKQKRRVVLKWGKRSITLELGDGHVWETDHLGTIGHPVHDAKKELALFERLLRGWKKKGYRVEADTGLSTTAAPKKPAGMSARTWRWVGDADEILSMWRDDDYDNHKDAILDARSMLKSPPADQKARVARLEKMLAKAERELQALAAKDPDIAEYARGLLPERKRKKKAGTKTKTKKTAR